MTTILKANRTGAKNNQNDKSRFFIFVPPTIKNTQLTFLLAVFHSFIFVPLPIFLLLGRSLLPMSKSHLNIFECSSQVLLVSNPLEQLSTPILLSYYLPLHIHKSSVIVDPLFWMNHNLCMLE